MTEQQTLERWGPIVARINSLRTPGNIYDIRYHLGRQEYSCNCPGWRFSRERPKQCRHTRYCFENRIGTEVATTGAIKQPDGRKRKAKTLAKVFEAEAKSLKPLPYDKLGDDPVEAEIKRCSEKIVLFLLAKGVKGSATIADRYVQAELRTLLDRIATTTAQVAPQASAAQPAEWPQTNIRFITFDD